MTMDRIAVVGSTTVDKIVDQNLSFLNRKLYKGKYPPPGP